MLIMYGPWGGVEANGTDSSITIRKGDIGPSRELAPIELRRCFPRMVPLELESKDGSRGE